MSSVMTNIFLKNLYDLSGTLKQLRLLEKLTQKQVAEAIGIKYQSYQAYELGIALPSLENFIKLCEFFDITPNEMLNIN